MRVGVSEIDGEVSAHETVVLVECGWLVHVRFSRQTWSKVTPPPWQVHFSGWVVVRSRTRGEYWKCGAFKRELNKIKGKINVTKMAEGMYSRAKVPHDLPVTHGAYNRSHYKQNWRR